MIQMGKPGKLREKKQTTRLPHLTTRNKFSWLYGRFEIRARFNPREGMWPAFWTLGVKEEWPKCGEIDIMEYYQSTYLANLCWASPKKYVGKWSSTYTPLKLLQKNTRIGQVISTFFEWIGMKRKYVCMQMISY